MMVGVVYAGGQRALSWPRVRTSQMCCLFDLNRTTNPEDTVILFTFKSDSLPNRRPPPLPEHGLFSPSGVKTSQIQSQALYSKPSFISVGTNSIGQGKLSASVKYS